VHLMTGAHAIDLSVPRSLGGILRAASRLYRRYPLLFLILALAVIAPWDLAVLAITGYGPLHSGGEGASASALNGLLRISLLSPLISALHVHAVVLAGGGERPRLRAVALQGLRVLPVVAAASIVSGLGIAIGFIFLVIPGVYLMLRWAVVAQVAAAEPGGWTDALARGSRLTANRYGHVFGVLIVSGVFGEAVSLAARAVSVGSASAGAVAAGIAAETLSASFGALTLALLYFDLASRAEARLSTAPREHPHLRDLD
jgi:hypothetical protein